MARTKCTLLAAYKKILYARVPNLPISGLDCAAERLERTEWDSSFSRLHEVSLDIEEFVGDCVWTHYPKCTRSQYKFWFVTNI